MSDDTIRREAPEPAELAGLLAGTGSVGDSLTELATSVLRAVRTHLGMEVGFISELAGDERVFRHVDSAGDDSPVRVGGRDLRQESYCQRVVDGRLPELIHDACELPAARELAATTELPVGAHLSVPIRLADGSIYGTLCCFSPAPDRSLNDRDLAVMRIFADLLGSEIDKNRQADLQRSVVVDRITNVMAGDGLSMVYQPILSLSSRRAVGHEALARFDDTRGPDVWFAEAAVAGMGHALELAAVRKAVANLAHFSGGEYVAVNASPSTVMCDEFVRTLAGVPMDRIVVEITEHAAIAAYDDLMAVLEPLRRRGVRVAVDDAGAGYASFRHVLQLDPDIIKLDMAITRDIDSDASRRALATAFVSFGRDTRSTIVAEGVETDSELATLRKLGVDAAQGYRLGRPAPCGAV